MNRNVVLLELHPQEGALVARKNVGSTMKFNLELISGQLLILLDLFLIIFQTLQCNCKENEFISTLQSSSEHPSTLRDSSKIYLHSINSEECNARGRRDIND